VGHAVGGPDHVHDDHRGDRPTAPAAVGSPLIVADGHLHGVASASAWLVSDNLGGAIFALLITAPVFALLAGGGAIIGCAMRAAGSATAKDR
jgi:hypothetical protein